MRAPPPDAGLLHLCSPACSDLTQLTYLNEPGILDVLRQRFSGSGSGMYTNAGCVLVAVNPFEELPLYGGEVAARYNRRRSTEDETPGEPHVFQTADRAFKQVGRQGSGPQGKLGTPLQKLACRHAVRWCISPTRL